MNVARFLVLAVALIAGGGAAYLAMNLIRSDPGPTAPSVAAIVAPPAMATDEVLVAVRDIALGTTIEADAFAWRAWPKSGIVGAYILRSEMAAGQLDIIGTIARTSFFAGEPITEAKLARTDGGLLAALLPAGMRAVAITISTDTGAGGFILPNDRVDVIMARPAADGDRYVTETILQNIRVLAIDQAIEDRNGQQVVIGRTATLELTPQQAEIVTVAQQMSDRLALALRSLADAQQVPGPQADAVHLINGDVRAEGVTVVRNGVAQRVGTAP